MTFISIVKKSDRRRGAVAVQVAIMLGVMLGFAALSVDVGHLVVSKAELQNAADSAALAGASAFAEDEFRHSAFSDGEFNASLAIAMATERAMGYAALNAATGRSVTLEDSDVVVGRFDPDNPEAPLSGIGLPNAVQVTTRFTEDSPNGPVDNFFAQVLGYNTTDVSATATASFADNMIGYTPPNNGDGALIPFTMHQDYFYDQVDNGPDNFSFDEDSEIIQNFPDGTREIRLFPYPEWDGSEGAGNFGILNVGTENQGAAALAEQIMNGITPEDIEAETGYPELTFADPDGDPTTYEVTGSPGLTGGLASAVQSRLGDVIGFFLHNDLRDPGSNAIYTIVEIRFARVMEVDLRGNPEDKRIILQPVVYTDPGVRIDSDVDGSDGLVGQIVLVR